MYGCTNHPGIAEALINVFRNIFRFYSFHKDFKIPLLKQTFEFHLPKLHFFQILTFYTMQGGKLGKSDFLSGLIVTYDGIKVVLSHVSKI